MQAKSKKSFPCNQSRRTIFNAGKNRSLHRETALRPDRAPYRSVGSARLCERNPTLTGRKTIKGRTARRPPKCNRGDNQNGLPGGTGGSTTNLMCGLKVQRRTGRAAGRHRPVRHWWWGWVSVRRVALAEPSLPYARIRRPVGAKSRVPVERGGDDWGRASGGIRLRPRK
jgi:hypothetical protein